MILKNEWQLPSRSLESDRKEGKMLLWARVVRTVQTHQVLGTLVQPLENERRPRGKLKWTYLFLDRQEFTTWQRTAGQVSEVKRKNVKNSRWEWACQVSSSVSRSPWPRSQMFFIENWLFNKLNMKQVPYELWKVYTFITPAVAEVLAKESGVSYMRGNHLDKHAASELYFPTSKHVFTAFLKWLAYVISLRGGGPGRIINYM